MGARPKAHLYPSHAPRAEGPTQLLRGHAPFSHGAGRPSRRPPGPSWTLPQPTTPGQSRPRRRLSTRAFCIPLNRIGSADSGADFLPPEYEVVHRCQEFWRGPRACGPQRKCYPRRLVTSGWPPIRTHPPLRITRPNSGPGSGGLLEDRFSEISPNLPVFGPAQCPAPCSPLNHTTLIRLLRWPGSVGAPGA